MARGHLIVFEGLDRAGKTTQCQLLAAALEADGRKVEFMRFPDRTTPIGRLIDGYLRGEAEVEDHVIHLLFSANRWEAVPKILTTIASGTTLIIDRYYYSGLVYSAAKRLPALTLPWCRHADVGLPRPDVVVFLDICAAAAAQRGGYGAEKYETGEMQGRVRELFREVRGRAEGEDFVVVDAGGEVGEVGRVVGRVVRERLERVEGPLRVVGEW
ncbi:thymidylate kinase [Lizonia empirigonia]|nr:thymidylate kinase [Lizonia empirigonia]